MTRIGLIGALLIFMVFGTNGLQAQTNVQFEARSADLSNQPSLNAYFKDYRLFELPVHEIDSWVNSAEYDYHFTLSLPGYQQWDIALFPHDIKAEGYKVRTPNGTFNSGGNISFRGHIGKGGESNVRFVINGEYLSGLIELNGKAWFIEPAYRMDQRIDRKLFLVYEKEDVIPNENAACMAVETEEFKRQQTAPKEERLPGEVEAQGQVMMDCLETEVATAHDKFMYDKYGSVAACESHAITVMNNVATNWDNEFADEIQFYIGEQYVETTNQNFPTSSTNAGTVLNAFRQWGNSGGFSGNFDVGQLWTNRDFDGGTVGIAYLNAVCGGNKYHALQDFTNNQQSLRVLVSHELGHNFSCQHDAPGSPFIMAPAVNNSNQWSAASVNAVNNFVNSIGCLASCNTAQPPVANFTANVTNGCVPLTVQFTDLSTNSPTSWSWSFPGGSPSSSTQQNPVVIYNTPGVYDVTLTASNFAGSDTRTITGYIVVEDVPLADFDFVDNELIVEFFNQSQDADLLTWDFGDGTNPITGAPGQNIPGGTHQGRTTGTFNNPIHVYDMDGFYVVTLTAINNCGADVSTQGVEVVSPVTADFDSDVQNGCATLEVNFTSTASPNTTQWFWEFPGGSPATSTQENPQVFYSQAGVYNVILEVSNSRYTDRIVRNAYITVQDKPETAFDYDVNNRQVVFDNNTVNGTTVIWDFGDGNISNQENPVHTYQLDSIYLVSLVTTNGCGNDTAYATITVGAPPVAAFSSNVSSGCEPLTVSFINQSSPNATRFDWIFEGGDPANSTQSDPVVLYSDPGTFDVTLIAYNGIGSDTVFFANYISVDPLPIADFSNTIDSNRVEFTNGSEYGSSYLWDFGDGQSSTQSDPEHTYELDGSYTVVLVTSNSCGQDTFSLEIEIATMPMASFSQDVTEGCAPLTVAFENNSSENSVSFEWHFPGGVPNTSFDENPVVVYDQAGSYDVTLIAFNNQGADTIVQEDLIVVNDVPEAEFDAQVDLQIVSFENLSLRGVSYLWNFGDGTSSTEADPVHSYSANGTYEVWLYVENDCGQDSVLAEVEISAYPVASFNSDTTSGCGPLSVQFFNTSAQSETVEWTFDGGTPQSSTEEDPIVVYDVPGTYEVRLVAINALGQDTIEIVDFIEVFGQTVAGFSFSVNGYVANFDNTSQNGTSFFWDFGDGNTSMENSPLHEYSAPGTYTATLISEGICGADTISYEVEINDLSPVISIATNANRGCTPLTVQFMDLSTNNPTSWNWVFEGGQPMNSNEQNPEITYSIPGVYRVTLEVSNNFGTSKAVFDSLITVLPNPESAFDLEQMSDTVQFTNTSSNYTRLEWDFGDGNTSTESDPQHIYEKNGSYTVTLVVFNECGSDTTTKEVVISVSFVNGIEPLGHFSVFPNPNNGQFSVLLKERNLNGTIEAEVRDVVGRQILYRRVDVTDLVNGLNLEIPGNGAGTYILILRQADRMSVYKMTVIQ